MKLHCRRCGVPLDRHGREPVTFLPVCPRDQDD